MATTMTTERSTMIAVFADRDQANRAIDDLRHAGYSYDQIRLVQRGTNSFIENLKSLFTGQVSTNTSSADDWMRVGVPEQDAHNYQNELDAGRNIVLVKAVNNPEQALSIMRQSGAYDIASRLRMAQSPRTQGNYQPNPQPGAYNPNPQSGTYSPDTAPEVPDPNAQPETYNRQSQPHPASTQDEQNV